jgi:inner membrane protein involved in colicin E2 resistance
MTSNPTRPWPILLFGILVFLRAFLTMLAIYLPGIQNGAGWTPAFLSFMTIALIGVAYGYWKMRRWGPWALLVHGVVFVGVYSLALRGHGWAAALFIYVVGLAIGVFYYRRMT